jgi:hypothetical protein
MQVAAFIINNKVQTEGYSHALNAKIQIDVRVINVSTSQHYTAEMAVAVLLNHNKKIR